MAAEAFLAMALSGGDYMVIGALLAGFVGLPATIIVITEQGLAGRMERTELRIHERIDGVQTEVRQLDQRKVEKVDWVSEVVKNRRKLEQVGEQLSGISARLDGAATIGTAVNKLADQLGRMAERNTHG